MSPSWRTARTELDEARPSGRKIRNCIPICRRIWAGFSVALVLTGLRGHGKEDVSVKLERKRKEKRWSCGHQNVCEHVAGGDECNTEPKKDSCMISDSCCSQQRRGHTRHPQQLQDDLRRSLGPRTPRPASSILTFPSLALKYFLVSPVRLHCLPLYYFLSIFFCKLLANIFGDFL